VSLPFLRTDGAKRSARVEKARFNLMRWFSVTALFSVAAVTTLCTVALSAFLTKRMVRQEAELTAGFVRNLIATENAYAFFEARTNPTDPMIGNIFSHISRMPDVVRTNIYSLEHQVIWSSDPLLIGRRFDPNEELDQALNAELIVNSGVIDRDRMLKSEHLDFSPGVRSFIESYIPVFDEHGTRVIGVVEVYKTPRELFDAIRSGQRLLWVAAFAAGVFLYGTLFWIVRRAHWIIERQREQLIEAEAMAVVGEMSSAVAHGLRNPLASIRSSAELTLSGDLSADAREYTSDIVAQVDRLERWIRQLLTYAKPTGTMMEAVDINAVLKESMEGYRHDLERQKTSIRLELPPDLPPVRGEKALLGQLIGSLISNAMEALHGGGEIALRARAEVPGGIVVEVADNGPGLASVNADKVFKPFFTTKQKGLGLGLPIVRRGIERLGGAIEFESEPGKGTVVRLHLRVHDDGAEGRRS
jgi:two-component system, NtrC family, sensor histidine kinase HydH